MREAWVSIMGLTKIQRIDIADEIVKRIDTVTLLRCEEVTDIRQRAISGEFDSFNDQEALVKMGKD